MKGLINLSPMGSFFGASAAFIFLLILSTFGSEAYGIAPSLLALIFSIGIYSLLRDLSGAEPHPLKIVFFLYFTFFFSLPAFLHTLWYGFPFYSKSYQRSSVEFAALISLACVLVSYISYSFFQKKRRATSHPSRDPAIQRPREVSAIVCWLFLGFSIVAATALGWQRILALRGDIESMSVGTYVLTIATRETSFVALIYATLWRGPVPIRILLVGGCLAGFLVTNNPLSIPRFLLASYVFSLFAIHSSFGRLQRTIFVTFVVIGLASIFPAISNLSRKGGSLRDSILYIDEYARSGDFDGFQSVVNVVEYVSDTGFKLGINIASAMMAFVPREIWPNKSPGTGKDAAAHVGYDFVNISSPLPAELYIDFGLIGLVLGSLLVGFLLSRGDSLFLRGDKSAQMRVMLAILFGMMIIILRGSLIAVVAPIGLVLVLAYIHAKASGIFLAVLRRAR